MLKEDLTLCHVLEDDLCLYLYFLSIWDPGSHSKVAAVLEPVSGRLENETRKNDQRGEK